MNCTTEVNYYNLYISKGFSCQVPIVLCHHVKANSWLLSWDVSGVDDKTLEHVLLNYEVPPAKLEMSFTRMLNMSQCIFVLKLVTKRFWQCRRLPMSTYLDFQIKSVDTGEEWLDLRDYSIQFGYELQSIRDDCNILTYTVGDHSSGRMWEFSC